MVGMAVEQFRQETVGENGKIPAPEQLSAADRVVWRRDPAVGFITMDVADVMDPERPGTLGVTDVTDGRWVRPPDQVDAEYAAGDTVVWVEWSDTPSFWNLMAEDQFLNIVNAALEGSAEDVEG